MHFHSLCLQQNWSFRNFPRINSSNYSWNHHWMCSQILLPWSRTALDHKIRTPYIFPFHGPSHHVLSWIQLQSINVLLKFSDNKCICYYCYSNCGNYFCSHILLWIKRNSLSFWIFNKLGIWILYFSNWSSSNNFNILSFECKLLDFLHCLWWKHFKWRFSNCFIKYR